MKPPRHDRRRPPARRSIDAPTETDPLRDPALYFNRELSQLEFNFRVLAQAQDPQRAAARAPALPVHLLHQPRRVLRDPRRHAAPRAGLRPAPPAADGLRAGDGARRASTTAPRELVDAQYDCWNEVLRPALNEAGVRVLARDDWNAKQTRWLRDYFRDEIMPVLSPLGLDPAHPFPRSSTSR